MSKKFITDIKKTRFVTSPKSEEIFNIITQYQGKLSKGKIYKKVKEIDPEVPSYQAFLNFLSRLDSNKEKRVRSLMNDFYEMVDKESSESNEKLFKNFFDTFYAKLFSMGDTVINQELETMKKQVENGENLSEKQKDKVMNWFFRGVESYNKKRAVDANVQNSEREERLFDNLLDAIQYGKASKDDLVLEGEFE